MAKDRITVTISFPWMTRVLAEEGVCEVEGLGKFTVADDGSLQFDAEPVLMALKHAKESPCFSM